MVGQGRGPTTVYEVFSVSADFKCFTKGVWGHGGGPLVTMKDSLFYADLKCFLKEEGVGPGWRPTNDDG